MADPFIPKPGTAYLFPNAKKVEDWQADFTGTIITTEDIQPNTAYWVYVTNKVNSQGKEFVKIAFGNQFVPRTQELQESAKGADVEDDGDVPF